MAALRQFLAAMGLVVVAYLAFKVARNEIELTDAAIRAVAVFIAAAVLTKLAGVAVSTFADTLDGQWKGEVAEPVADDQVEDT